MCFECVVLKMHFMLHFTSQSGHSHVSLERGATQGSPRLHRGLSDPGERRRPTLIRQDGKGNVPSTYPEFCSPPTCSINLLFHLYCKEVLGAPLDCIVVVWIPP